MFERLLAFLFCLYPLEFRRAYGREAWQLIQDRLRVERSMPMRVRLLLDLVRDLLAMSVRGWHPNRALITAGDVRDGTPRFQMIEVPPRRPEWYVAGMLSSMLMFGSFAFLFEPTKFVDTPLQVGEGSGEGPEGFPSEDNGQAVVADAGDERRKIIAAVAAMLEDRYVDRAIGRQLSNALLAQEKNREFESARTGQELAERLTTRIHEMSLALGVPAGAYVADVIYSAMALAEGPPSPPNPIAREQYRLALLKQNCHYQATEMLPNQIGYIKLAGFPEVTACEEITRKAMASLNDAAGLIIDLRDNGGGFGESALQIASYFFNRPTFLWDPRPHTSVPAETASPVASNKLGDKPLYILTSARTQSAAEYFAYNMKMLKRATVVGETTAGHQHSGAFHRIADHFGMGIQEEAPAANPFPIKGWEAIGVEPDVRVSSAEALETARKLADAKASSARPR